MGRGDCCQERTNDRDHVSKCPERPKSGVVLLEAETGHGPQFWRPVAQLVGSSNLRLLEKRITEKGAGTFSSRHEILGCVTEEYHELIEAIRTDGFDKKRIIHELLDVACSCVFGLACIEAKLTEW